MRKRKNLHSGSRREFVKAGLAGAVGFALGSQSPASAHSPAAEQLAPPCNPRTFAAMPTRNLGKTGYRVGIFSLGGQATIEKPDKEEEAVAIVNRAIDLGVDYIDTAAAYGGPDQWSQKYIGKVMKTRRNEVFLASKTHLRTYDESMRLLEGSLKQLNTDHLDLWQLHNIRKTEELDKIFAKDGAIHALEKARSEKAVRFLGITGHANPHVLADGRQRRRPALPELHRQSAAAGSRATTGHHRHEDPGAGTNPLRLDASSFGSAASL
jgi:hypothetical protein